MISIQFQLAKTFEFTEGFYYPVEIGWKSSNEKSMETDEEITKTTAVFKVNDAVPNSKLLKFQKKEDFHLFALYGESVSLLTGTNKRISKFLIHGISKDKKIDEIRVKIGINKSGIMFIENAQQIEEIEVWEEVKKDEKKEEKKEEVKKRGRKKKNQKKKKRNLLKNQLELIYL